MISGISALIGFGNNHEGSIPFTRSNIQIDQQNQLFCATSVCRNPESENKSENERVKFPEVQEVKLLTFRALSLPR